MTKWLKLIPRRSLWIISVSMLITAVLLLILYGYQVQYQQIDELSVSSMLSPELCLSFESYDPAEHACVAKCTGESCDKLEKNYRRSLDALSLDDLKLYFAFDESPFQDAFGTNAEMRYTSPLDPNTVANKSYAVHDGTLGAEISHVGHPTFARSPEEMWRLFQKVIPPEDQHFVDEFLVLHDFNGSLDALAWVIPDGATTTTWQVAFNEGVSVSPHGYFIDRGNVIHTVVHETGHLITLNADQLDPSIFVPFLTSCHAIFLPEGCPKKNSYMAKFVQDFWPEQIGTVEAPSGEFVTGKYVSGYAADNPTEDIAESWTAFVLLPKPTGSTIAEKKILFFYDYPEFVRTRTAIRDQIGKLR